MVQPGSVEIEWTRGTKKGTKQKVSQADAAALTERGWAKALDAPPKDKAVKEPVKKK